MSGEKPENLQHPAPPSPADIRDLMNAADEGNARIVADWLDRFGPERVDVRDDNGRTALVWAACESRNEVMRVLLTRGANPEVNAAADNEMTPLVACITQGNQEGIVLLAEHGADLEKPHNGASPVHLALDWLNPETVVTLVRLGADLEARNKAGQTVIESARDGAAKYGYDAILPYLLEQSCRRAGEAAAREVQQGLAGSVAPMKKIVLSTTRRPDP